MKIPNFQKFGRLVEKIDDLKNSKDDILYIKFVNNEQKIYKDINFIGENETNAYSIMDGATQSFSPRYFLEVSDLEMWLFDKNVFMRKFPEYFI